MTNDSTTGKSDAEAGNPAWKEIVVKYQKPAVGRSMWQVAGLVIPAG